ncbi:MAG: hypothetical protein AAFQ66_16050 [Pseudomonadota bacterium]
MTKKLVSAAIVLLATSAAVYAQSKGPFGGSTPVNVPEITPAAGIAAIAAIGASVALIRERMKRR